MTVAVGGAIVGGLSHHHHQDNFHFEFMSDDSSRMSSSLP
jgi:hypothetical protein